MVDLTALIAFPSTSKIDRRLAPHAIWMALAPVPRLLRILPPTRSRSSRARRDAANIPDGAHVTGLIEEPRSNAIRQAALVHAAALIVREKTRHRSVHVREVHGPPVVFLPGHEPPYPDPSWEWDPSYYRPDSAVTAQYPWVLVRTSWEEEPTEMMRSEAIWPDSLEPHESGVPLGSVGVVRKNAYGKPE
ncbi:MAG: hypothetical protein U0165_08670 [Polyangiaceae bacterium]